MLNNFKYVKKIRDKYIYYISIGYKKNIYNIW